MGRLCDQRVPEYIVQRLVDALEPGEEFCGAEHMFGRVRVVSDGSMAARSGSRSRPTYAADPSDDQTSILVRTRSMTAAVKSLVVVEPPRSGVFIPAPTVSSADS